MRRIVMVLPLALARFTRKLPARRVLDRIAVTVDRQIIAESDVIRFLRVAAFLDDKPVDLSGPSKRTAARGSGGSGADDDGGR